MTTNWFFFFNFIILCMQLDRSNYYLPFNYFQQFDVFLWLPHRCSGLFYLNLMVLIQIICYYNSSYWLGFSFCSVLFCLRLEFLDLVTLVNFLHPDLAVKFIKFFLGVMIWCFVFLLDSFCIIDFWILFSFVHW